MNTSTIILICLGTLFLMAGGIGGCLYGWPQYKVYQKSMRGKADFSEAEINRQILVEEARAKEEALMMVANGEAERERIRAKASADAIQMIGESLRDNEGYLRWLWINGLHDDQGERIYIPTEANLPILEATR